MKSIFVCFLTAVVAVHSQDSSFFAVIDTHGLDALSNSVTGTLEMGTGDVTLSRASSAPVSSLLLGAMYGANFSTYAPPALPSARTDYFELTFSGITGGGSSSGLYLYFGTLRGEDAPEYLSVSTSLDAHQTVVATVVMSVGANEATVRVPTNGPLPSTMTIRLSPATASANESATCFIGLANSPLFGRFAIFTAPLVCPAGASPGCRHVQPSLTSRVWEGGKSTPAGLHSHGAFGLWRCASAIGVEMGVRHECECDCFEPPEPLIEVCDPTSASSGHAFVGAACAPSGDITVTTQTDVTNLDTCDTITGNLVVNLGTTSAEVVVFPRLRRVAGTLTVEGTKIASASFPLLERVGGLDVSGSALTALYTPRLADVCGGSIKVGASSLDHAAFPMLGSRKVSTLQLRSLLSVDVGSVAGGPVEADTVDVGAYTGSRKLHTVTGLAALQRVWDKMSTGLLSHEAAHLGWLAGVAIGGDCGSGRAAEFSMTDVNFGDAGETGNITVDLRETRKLTLKDVDELAAFAAPNACGSRWTSLYVGSNGGSAYLKSLDVGHIGGGPEHVDGELRIQGSTFSNKLETVRGLERLHSLSGDLHLSSLGVGAFPARVFDLQFTGTGQDMYIRYCDYGGRYAFANLVYGGRITAQDNSALTTLELPAIVTWTKMLVSSNNLIHTVDLGSASGGPTTVSSAYEALSVSGGSGGFITTFRGLSRLSSISGSVQLWKFRTAFPPMLRTASFSATSSLSMQYNAWTETELTLPGVTGLEGLLLARDENLRAFRLPNLGGQMLSLRVDANFELVELDLGSAAGITSLRSNNGVFFTFGGSPTGARLQEVKGLDHLEEIECTKTSCYAFVRYIDILPEGLRRALWTGTFQAYIGDVRPTAPVEWDLNITSFSLMSITGCRNVTAVRMPDVAYASAVAAFRVYDNEGLVELDVGSVGGGFASISAGATPTALFVAGTPTTTLETVRGFGALTSITGTNLNSVNVSWIGNNTDDLRAAVERMTYVTGGTKQRELVVHATPWTELRVPGVTSVEAVYVTDNCCLEVFKLPNLVSVVEMSVHGNPQLPDGCAIDLAPAAGTATQYGNRNMTACPP
eukprot:TRINITY_DN3304_c0_g1_i1.p1 TRINITY_DN3304_c0_g1~~TRINITY_DN3304_c0_g1_i1.p1  ORF type:complete len:1113 (+),score=219.07 TRINITY_DN3304_c0_g1_i1:62-3340(+)